MTKLINKYVVTYSEEEWLERRKRSISSTDIAAIMGMNPYVTPLDIYNRKISTEESPGTVDNKYTRMGKRLEPIIASLFHEATGIWIERNSNNNTIEKEVNGVNLLTTPDGLIYQYEDPENRDGEAKLVAVAEFKSTQQSWKEPPVYYEFQLMWTMGLLGVDTGYLIWLERGLDFKYKEYKFDSMLFEMMVNAAVGFWNNHIRTMTPPMVVDKLNSIEEYEAGSAIKVDANGDILEKVYKATELAMNIEQAQEELDELQNAIKEYIGEHQYLVDDNGVVLATHTKVDGAIRFNTTKFKKDYPELYEKYTMKGNSYKRFTLNTLNRIKKNKK